MADPHEQFDIAIVGSGVAGALIAWRLAMKSFKTVVLEAGERGPARVNLVASYAVASNKTPHSPYKSAKNDLMATSPDSPADYVQDPAGGFRSGYERRIGGSTAHWLGHTPRLIPSDFEMWTRYGVGVDWPISYADLEPWYCAAEEALGVAGDDEEWRDLLRAYRSKPFPMSKIWPSYSDTKVAEALAGVEFDGIPFSVASTPSARNSQPYDGRPVCAGNSICVPICPIQAKYDATVHVAKAEAAGAIIREKSVACLLGVGSDGRIEFLTYKTWDGQSHTIRARTFVIAAHAIETPRLLLLSKSDGVPNGVANSSGQVGCNLMDHLQKSSWAEAPFALYPFRGPPSTSGIEVFRDGPFRKERGAFRLSLNNDGWSRLGSPQKELLQAVNENNLFGVKLRQRLEQVTLRQLRLSCSAEVLPDRNNSVTLDSSVDALGLKNPRLSFRESNYTTEALSTALKAMEAMYDALKATNRTYQDEYSGAGHIMGTSRMGSDPRTSVVDRTCRSHDHQNLFIVGSSVFPTCGTANPTLTVAALALKSVGDIAKSTQSA